MTKSRRDFLKVSAFAVAGMLASRQAYSYVPGKNDVVGIQLYSVRDGMRKDPLDTLKQLSRMGYRNVEHAGYANRKFYGYDPREFRKILDDMKLKMVSGHVRFGLEDWDSTKNDFSDAWKHTIEDAVIAGQNYLVTPWMNKEVRTDYDQLMRLIELFNKSGELCNKSGIKLGYHNHDFEFSTHVRGKVLYDIILDGMEKNLVVQQLDMGNMLIGGVYPMDVIKAHPGRFEMMHVKDEIPSKAGKGEMGGDYESTVLGKGILKVKDVLDLAKKTGGTTQFIIEQESYQQLTPLEASKADLLAMKKWGYGR